MRILIIASFIPYPPDSGARIRTWEIARHFHRDHEVVFALHVRSQDDLARADAIRQQGFQVITGRVNTGLRAAFVAACEVLSGGPPLFALRRSDELEKKLARMHAETPFDVIQIEHFELARYPRIIRAPRESIRAMVLHDVLSVAYARMATVEGSLFWRLWRRYNSFRLRTYERKLLPGYDACITVSAKDRDEISGFVEPSRIHVMPNCIDSAAKPFLAEPSAGAPSVLFVGLFLHPPNADAARWMIEEILPSIRALVTDCVLHLVGAGAPRHLQELVGANRQAATLAGHVDDVMAYYAACQVAVVPLRAGGGTRLKILEAMAFGRPVVSTTLGAEGLCVKHGEHLLLADTAEDFARAVVLLLQDPALRNQLRSNARSFVERCHRWEDCASAHLRMYENLRQSGSRRDR